MDGQGNGGDGMKNCEKYKTSEERTAAFEEYCKGHSCAIFPCKKWGCAFEWLELEAEGGPLPCPFCGGKTKCHKEWNELHRVTCTNPKCWYSAAVYTTGAGAIAAHNRVAKAVMEAKEETK